MVDMSEVTATVKVEVLRVTVDGETLHDERDSAPTSEAWGRDTYVTTADGRAVTVEFAFAIDGPLSGGGAE